MARDIFCVKVVFLEGFKNINRKIEKMKKMRYRALKKKSNVRSLLILGICLHQTLRSWAVFLYSFLQAKYCFSPIRRSFPAAQSFLVL